MLAASALACRRGGRLVFDVLDLALSPGEALMLRGPNGSGKTNLVRILCELLSPVSGEVRWKGTSTRVLRYAHRREWVYIGPANCVWRSTYSGEGGSYGVGD